MAKTILNIMLARGKGGLEQALLDYSDALTAAGYKVINIVHPNGWAAQQLDAQGQQGHVAKPLSPLGEWDIFAARKLRAIAKEVGADAAICHGNRAIGQALRGVKGHVPIYAVAHNYNIRRFPRCDGAFCITRDLIEELVRLDMPRAHLYHMPNLVRAPEQPAQPFTQNHPKHQGQQAESLVAEGVSSIAEARRPEQGEIIKIKSMGRFVEKKGFTYYLEALAILKKRGHAFVAELGGDGLLAPLLVKQAKELGLSDADIHFSGWVQDKDAFWRDTDIFVLPSLHEPFGIVLIEAMSHALPCVTTDSEGPCEIIANGEDALLARKADGTSLADAIERYLQDPEMARKHGELAREKCLREYSIPRAAERLKAVLQ